ncbi:serine/threonine-protein kinase [Myxococcota bacterium]
MKTRCRVGDESFQPLTGGAEALADEEAGEFTSATTGTVRESAAGLGEGSYLFDSGARTCVREGARRKSVSALLRIVRCLLTESPEWLKLARDEPPSALLYLDRLHAQIRLLAEAIIAIHGQLPDARADDGAWESADRSGAWDAAAMDDGLPPNLSAWVGARRSWEGALAQERPQHEEIERVTRWLAMATSELGGRARKAHRSLVAGSGSPGTDSLAAAVSALAQGAEARQSELMRARIAASLPASRQKPSWEETTQTGHIGHEAGTDQSLERTAKPPSMGCGEEEGCGAASTACDCPGCAAQAESPGGQRSWVHQHPASVPWVKPRSGLEVVGHFKLESRLGEGGMGTVWKAVQMVTGKRFALKFIKPTQDSVGERAVARFRREARALALASHPHIVRIHDVLELEDGLPMIVMDLLDGESLRKRLDRERRLTLPQVAQVLCPVLSAVASVHAAGMVHRDLKPENIFLARGPADSLVPKVVDFGIAKLGAQLGSEEDTGSPAGDSGVLGTIHYGAWEQVSGQKEIDHRVDVWSMGCVIYECLAGRRPIVGDNRSQIIRALWQDAIVPLAELLPDLPSEVLCLVSRMLTKNRDQRLQDLDEARRVLRVHADIRNPA